MDTLLQQLINGLTLGAVYALVALGYTMVYGIIGLINFAHGEVVMIGTMVAFTVLVLLAGQVTEQQGDAIASRHAQVQRVGGEVRPINELDDVKDIGGLDLRFEFARRCRMEGHHTGDQKGEPAPTQAEQEGGAGARCAVLHRCGRMASLSSGRPHRQRR